MILSSVVIILGEVLEATILTSIFLALSQRFETPRNWFFTALLTGITGAALYAIFFDVISQWADGFGQEIFNASIQLGIYGCLCLFNALVYSTKQDQIMSNHLTWIMTLGVSLAITREGAEIFLYLSGFIASDTLITSTITGGVIGAGIGLSVGILLYYFFVSLNKRLSLYLGYSLLLLVAAGMILQAVRLLIQIDWLPSQEIVWDVSNWINEASAAGRLLYTLIGYEATPTLIEIQFYIAALFGVLLTTGITLYISSTKNKETL